MILMPGQAAQLLAESCGLAPKDVQHLAEPGPCTQLVLQVTY